MSWWSKLWKGFEGAPKNAPEKPRSEPAEWLATDDPGNPFDVPILDLMSNLRVTSTTEDPALAERSVSWRAGQDERLAWKLDGERFSCDLSYDAATSLPDGMLFVPAAMEDKSTNGLPEDAGKPKPRVALHPTAAPPLLRELE